MNLGTKISIACIASLTFIVGSLCGATPYWRRPGHAPSLASTESSSPAGLPSNCGYFNEMVITDPIGDAGADPNVDVVSLAIRQWGESLRLQVATNGSTYDVEGSDIDFMIGFDIDQDPATGLPWAGLGVEVRIWVWTGYQGRSILDRYDSSGAFLGDEEGPRIRFNSYGFDFALATSRIGSTDFDLSFIASGGDPFFCCDSSVTQELSLEPLRPDTLAIESDGVVLRDKPRTIHIPQKGVGVELRTVLTLDGVENQLSVAEVTYEIKHPASHVISDPESIISVDADGVAHYVSEGFVLVQAVVDACELASEPTVIATGDVFGDPNTDDVIAIFPAKYKPGNRSFEYMMTNYPKYMALVNTAYRVTGDLYGGWKPLQGDTQLFALLDIPGHCGGAGNPLETGPCCYMNCGDGSPHYSVVLHEMGHNFHMAPAMWRFLTANWRFNSANVYECVASLPVIYFANEIKQDGPGYGFGLSSWEWGYFNDFVAADRTDWDVLDNFEAMLSSGQTTGFFDNPGLFDSISLFCSFFQAHIYGYKDYSTPYGHEMIRRFINIFDGGMLPEFEDDLVETYFAAAFSAAAGLDLRPRLSHWGFAIDDAYYQQILPLVRAKIREVFSDSFESGDCSAWSMQQPRP